MYLSGGQGGGGGAAQESPQGRLYRRSQGGQLRPRPATHDRDRSVNDYGTSAFKIVQRHMIYSTRTGVSSPVTSP